MQNWKTPILLQFRSPVSLVLTICALFLALYNWRFWQETAAVFVDQPGGLPFIFSLFAVLLLIHALFLVLIPSRRLLLGISSVLFIISAITAYAADTYGTQIDVEMIRNFAQTDRREAFALFNLRFVAYLLVLGALPAALIWLIRVKQIGWQLSAAHRAGFISAALLLCTGLIALQSAHYAVFLREHKSLRFWLSPGSTINGLVLYAGSVLPKQSALPFEPAPPTFKINRTATSKPLLLFLVVGETVRADNVQLGGYARATTPQLARMQDVFYFNNVWSCGTATAVSLPCMFSTLGREKFDADKALRSASLIDALAAGGVELEWRDNNSGHKGIAERVASIDNFRQRSPSFCNADSCFDEVMLEDLDQRIAALNGDTTIVFHQMGSHGPAYSKRYPEKFKTFTPTCDTNLLTECSSEQIRNAYDNSIVYTDHNLARQITLLRSLSSRFDSVLIYVSDHGESLGEKGLYLHGAPYLFAPDQQKHVPLLMWMSDGYKKRAQLSESCLRSKLQQAYSHDNLYSTVMGVMERRNRFYKREMDMLAGCMKLS